MNATIQNKYAVFFATALVVAGFSLGANVALAAFDVTISTDGNGTISGIVSGLPPTIIPATMSAVVNVATGKSANFTFNAASSYAVSDVLVDGVSVGAPPNRLFPSSTVGSHTLSVSFALIAPYTITASAGANGSISPSGALVVPVSETRTFAIVPSLGFSVADVLVDGISQGAITSYMFPTFPSGTTDHTISASFSANTYTISVTAGANGSISPSGNVSVSGANNQAFSITPSAGFTIADVLADGVSVGAATSYTFTNVIADHTISATFAADVVPPSPPSGGGGGGSSGGGGGGGSGAGSGLTTSIGLGAPTVPTQTASVVLIPNPVSVKTPVIKSILPSVPKKSVASIPFNGQFSSALSLGSRGPAVTELQKRLTADGVYAGPITGFFGPLTQASVKAFQNKYHLAAVGSVGPQTRNQLNGLAKSPATKSIAEKPAAYQFTANAGFGVKGESVFELQKRLKTEGVYTGPITGFFGVLTQAAVKAYQEQNNLAALGILELQTREKLNGK